MEDISRYIRRVHGCYQQSQSGGTPAASVNWACNRLGAWLQFAFWVDLQFIGVELSGVEWSGAVSMPLRGI
jgi:hypothetical protein